MKTLIFAVLFLNLSTLNLFSQNKNDYNWIYGFETLDLNGNSRGVQLNFNDAPVNVDSLIIPLKIYLSNATISDNNGDLLFYTNGCAIANKNHEIMLNSEGLNPGQISNSNCEYGYSGGNQSCLILPISESETQYYLFHQASTYDPNLIVYTNKLYYTLVDMSLEEGLGDVVEKNILLREDTLRGGEMTAIKHSNGADWWLINGSYDSDEFFTFLITADSIEGPFFQNIGFVNTRAGSGSGQVVFSPDGTKFARYNKIDHLYLYDFDRATGLFSNFEHIMVDDTIRSGGCAISSNSRFLYVSTRGRLFQFDLEADDIKASQVFIDEYDGYVNPLPTSFFQMQLAPDCRIFMNSTNTVNVLHVIHNPNEKGLACNFEQRGIQLPSNHQISMPHFPYYRMDTDYPICDSSLVVSSMEVVRRVERKMRAYPNPASDKLTVTFEEELAANGEISIVNIVGQVIKSFKITEGSISIDISLESVNNGIYLLQLKEGNQPIQVTTIKVLK